MSNLRGFYNDSLNTSKKTELSKRSLVKARLKAKTKKARNLSKPKNTKAKRTKENIRIALIKYFNLNKYATNAAICLCIHNAKQWPMPAQHNGYPAYMKKYFHHCQTLGILKNNYISKTSSEEFYASKEWKELRFIALRMAEGTCELCGAKASDGVSLHVDHIKPRSKFPEFELDLENLQILCSDCNMGKSNYDNTDFRNR